MSKQHIALLRGINVGGRNMLPMKDLSRIFASLGCENVRTYIQSGNVVFEADAALAKSLAAKVSKRISEEFSLSVPVVMRSAREWNKAAGSHPFAKSGVAEKLLHVIFLADKPKPADIKQLDPNRSPGDEFKVMGREIYACFGRGVAGTKLTNAYFDRVLKTVSTARNWRTVQTLAEMAAADAH